LESHEKLMLNYRFKVLIDNQVASFSKISGLTMDVETEMIAEGGHNASGYIVEVPAKASKTLRLEGGIYKNSNSLLERLRPGMRLKQGLVIMVLGTYGNVQIKYSAERAYVTKWEVSELNAESGQVLIHTFEIAYTQLKIIK
jgi:phage tail-like protein